MSGKLKMQCLPIMSRFYLLGFIGVSSYSSFSHWKVVLQPKESQEWIKSERV